jgi:uncharacterized protein YbdZ (MbtH family)
MSLSAFEKEDNRMYKVVVNSEGQYSLAFAYETNPRGWKDAGKSGPKSECLAYVKEVWGDMTPLSLRKHMEEFAKNPAPHPVSRESRPYESLVDRLCTGDHHVEVSLRPEKTARAFKEAIDRNYVHVRFTQTRGGTELGVSLENDFSDLTRADFENGVGTAHVEGKLTLDYVKVKCVVDIDLSTLSGKGRLVRLESA